jgi:beta-glucanase (GH16 family)
VTIDPKNLSATATLTFGDEFNTLSLWNGTSGTWSTKYPFAPEKGGSLPSNGEQEWYINSMYAPTTSVRPWTVSNGVLTLTAQPASTSVQPLIDGYKYTSGMVNTFNSFTQTYGYFEMRAQLPAGQGLWPAFWLLQADMSWPPEIDAMEVLGHDMTTLYTASHTNETGSHTSKGGTIKVPDMSAGYHTYGVDWQADYITYYFDGNEVWKTATPSDMHEPMYMIANLAVGGYWPGMVNSTTPFPAQMKIDYIRAYSDKGVTPPPTDPPPTDPPPTDPPLLSKLFTLAESGAYTSFIRGSSRSETVNGTSAADKIDGRGGTDTLVGWTGNDTYLVNSPGDSVIENAQGGVDTVQSRSSSYTLGANVENLMLTSLSAQTGIGNALGNLMTSNNAASTLDGGAGNDILVAGRGAGILTGGAGSDIFQYNSVTSGGRVTDFTDGTDVLDLRGLFSNYNGTNPVADGYLSFSSDGAGGTRVYFDADGAGSSLKKLVTTLQGVSPSSLTLQSDVFFSSTAGSGSNPPPTTEPPPATSSGLFSLPMTGTGIDTVTTTASSYTLGSGVENLMLGGSGPQTGIGNTLNNILISNNAGSTLNGGAGNDILVAGRSWDVLTGGAGSDIFQFDALPWNNARITDFQVGTDMLDLRKLFTAANYQGTNPVADGYVSFQSDGAGGTKVYFDPDGTGSANPWAFLVTTIDNVQPSGLHMQTEWFFH